MQLAPQVVVVLQVHKVLKEVKGRQVIQVRRVQQEVLVQQELKELLDQQEDKVPKVDKDLVLVLKEQQEGKVLKVLKAYHHKVHKVLKERGL